MQTSPIKTNIHLRYDHIHVYFANRGDPFWVHFLLVSLEKYITDNIGLIKKKSDKYTISD